MDDAVARPHLVRLPVLPRDARAAEDEEDLLLVELDVDGRRALARIDEEPRDAHVARADGVAEVDADDAHRPGVVTVALDLVPVRDHGLALLEADRLRALPEHLLAELRQLLAPLDDGQEVVAGELPRLAREARLAVREEDLG